ncbi:ORF1+2p [Erigeron breviscapus amalgavirus 2]|uniref:ORF1+2p n=1 Tax=Erigeron breviscapus amalgavirus 2 TaxID=2069323 RepID=UPI000DC1CC63|nr:ORF1+2p [Erigeron breviscapus amalgavirus 2]DAB41683.1 TPA_inf: ORF1+2p [Erigeron breviscapus amalgavirus 2]
MTGGTGPSNQVHLLGLTPDQEQEQLTALSAGLVAEGFPAAIFSRTAAIDCGYDFARFYRVVKSMDDLLKMDLFDEVLTLAVTGLFFVSPLRCTTKKFCEFGAYLKTTKGQEALHGAQKMKKYQAKVIGEFEPKDVVLEQIFNAQRADYAEVLKEERSNYDREIEALKKQIRLLEARKEERLEQIAAGFAPASYYSEPDPADVAVEAWEMYQNDARAKGKVAMSRYDGGDKYAVANFGNKVKRLHCLEYCGDDASRTLLLEYCKKKILAFGPIRISDKPHPSRVCWLEQVETWLLSRPVALRREICSLVPVGFPHLPQQRPECFELSSLVSRDVLERKNQLGHRPIQVLARGIRAQELDSSIMRNPRLKVYVNFQGEPGRVIPHSRSKYEAALRRIIGGGAMRSWGEDSKMYRGGGTSSDALLLLSQADFRLPGGLLKEHFSLRTAREALCLPEDLVVPDGKDCCRMKNFNNEATAGPFLRLFGVKGKYGLKKLLEDEMWRYYDDFAQGRIDERGLPYFAARLGFRTKLMSEKKAWEKMQKGDPYGRAVMMLDALEQAASSPLYNVLTGVTFERRLEKECGFKNQVIRASSDWNRVWEYLRDSKVIIELDWAKFDRERPSEDLQFVIDVVLSCFAPRTPRERKLLEAYGIVMRRALIERAVVMDRGGVFTIEGMVPSGSLWTGWLDTALNILYLNAACVEAGYGPGFFHPMCAGDDNLTLFDLDLGDRRLLKIREVLNNWFRAGISEEDFFIHRPPFHVIKKQACFPPGTDLKIGTSKRMHEAFWVEFDGELVIDEAAGRSHRWEYIFKGRPKFLSNYWLPEGQPIRPTRDNLEKLLWPEGIHKDLNEYQAALMAMVVDNPWNHHAVNHLLMRYVIVQQLRRVNSGLGREDDTLFLAGLRDMTGGVIPFPMVAPWRRGAQQGRMEDYKEVQNWCLDFQSFVTGVTSLYTREATGGMDAWQFMEIIRGDHHVGEGQFGNDLMRWLQWMASHPCSKYLRPVRGLRPGKSAVTAEREDLDRAVNGFNTLRRLLSSGRLCSSLDYALWISHSVIDSLPG